MNTNCPIHTDAAADAFTRRLRAASNVVLVVDVANIAWGAMAGAMPEGLLGPGGKGILPAAYDGYTGGSWSELVRTSPITARYVVLMYRMYGIYCAVFGVMASAIAATAFRRGARWAWWTLLAGNTVALVSATLARREIRPSNTSDRPIACG